MDLFTINGKKTLQQRLRNIVKLYIEGAKYPFVAPMFGVGILSIRSKEHHEGMIDELAQILQIPDVMKFYKESKNNGNKN